MPSRFEPLTRLWIATDVLLDMRAEASALLPNETGGIVLGYFRSTEAVVTDCIGPGERAIHSRLGFVPNHEYQEIEVARAYGLSKGVVTYLGDWHTHPGGKEAPSRLDRKTLQRISRSSAARVEQPVMIILSGRPPWRVAGWQAQPRRGGTLRRGAALPVPISYYRKGSRPSE